MTEENESGVAPQTPVKFYVRRNPKQSLHSRVLQLEAPCENPVKSSSYETKSASLNKESEHFDTVTPLKKPTPCLLEENVKKRKLDSGSMDRIPSKKPKKKKHRPKVVFDRRPGGLAPPQSKTPKVKTPKPVKRKRVKKSQDTSAIVEPPTNNPKQSCKRALDFEEFTSNGQSISTIIQEADVHVHATSSIKDQNDGKLRLDVIALNNWCRLAGCRRPRTRGQGLRRDTRTREFGIFTFIAISKRFGVNFPKIAKRQRKKFIGRNEHKVGSVQVERKISNNPSISIQKKVTIPLPDLNLPPMPLRQDCEVDSSEVAELTNKLKSCAQKGRRIRLQRVSSTGSSGNLPLRAPRVGLDDSDDDAVALKPGKGVNEICKKLKEFHLSDGVNRFRRKKVQRRQSKPGKLVLYENNKNTKRPKLPEVYIDSETDRRWKHIMKIENISSEDRANDKKYWDKEQKVFGARILKFTSIMTVIQGDRRFRRWKGSVVDSVVGVYLTQNVSDHLSSSAYLSLAAKFPIQPRNNDETNVETSMIQHSNESCNYYVELASEPETDTSDELEIETEIEVETNESKETCHSESTRMESNIEENSPGIASNATKDTSSKKKKDVKDKVIEDWDNLRRMYSTDKQRSSDCNDSVDWEAVRTAEQDEVATAIRARGQHNIIAGKIQRFLSRLVKDHGSIDLEWLRNVPPEDTKRFLLDIYGLGLKSVECLRLLALEQVAFPVDINVARITARLGWVPMRELPNGVPFHLLEGYPDPDTIQKYLWPRLISLGHKKLYELHYHMITFGKIFCTKRNPSCNICPMRPDCKHYLSANPSSTPALPKSSDKTSTRSGLSTVETLSTVANQTFILTIEEVESIESWHHVSQCIPIIEEPKDTNSGLDKSDVGADAVGCCESDSLGDIEDLLKDGCGTSTIRLDIEKFMKNIQNSIVDLYTFNQDAPELKNAKRLRTEHLAYELPDSHALLEKMDKRDRNDTTPYLLTIWSPGETANSVEQPNGKCNSKLGICDEETCFACNDVRERNSGTVRGTILIPCRTATTGSFPLNGTYFQVNEVFADYETSIKPLIVVRDSIRRLPRRKVYFSTSTSSLTKGQTLFGIHKSFWGGFICVRGLDRKTGNPQRLEPRFHRSMLSSTNLKKEPKKKSKKREQR